MCAGPGHPADPLGLLRGFPTVGDPQVGPVGRRTASHLPTWLAVGWLAETGRPCGEPPELPGTQSVRKVLRR